MTRKPLVAAAKTLTAQKMKKPLMENFIFCAVLFLQCACYWYYFYFSFFILCDNWKTLLFVKVYPYSGIVLTAMFLISLKPVVWKKSVFHAISPQQQPDRCSYQSFKIKLVMLLRGGSSAAATSKMECFVIIVND